MNILQPIQSQHYLFNRIVGTGGIGSGMFFSFGNNETLGRNESRLGTLLPYKDYCKQHIIMHYVAVLLGAGRNNDFKAYPIGKVGDDDIGRSLIAQMDAAGMYTGHVSVTPGINTLFSVCMQYPDKSGGNITTDNSASGLVSPEDIDSYFRINSVIDGREIILSVPEVPLSARIKLLEYGRARGALNIACILSAEVEAFKENGGFGITDILSVNIDEAKSIGQVSSEDNALIIDRCIEALIKLNPGISVLITTGSGGVYCYTGNRLSHFPAYRVTPVSTAGAGDAFIAGTICGLCCGLPLSENDNEKTTGTLSTAVELGNLLAALSVTSQDTIHPDANADSLYLFSQSLNARFSRSFGQLFGSVKK